ncbi:Acetyltransferase (GNAT) domain-containing protein [Paenibacillus tianmuensis]|uniref:Acetyltransferase (GNAT) domain-containing protein n=1 Tax=Paenibacillus tianmuensis TaxID=624147 RepID=A0A1G4T811_9BACL|nr:GNAT family N-acetyltransferase [Paenibacillus tianmuensis]SCW77337.1 Acetyltransferase (GNAT) domain-containing protein [Paenibacillus tianmuensis]
MADIRLVRPNEMAEAVKLSDSIFRDAQQISMKPAFPDVFSTALGQSYGAFEDGKLVSFMGLVSVTIRIGKAMLGTYQLGSVGTDPAARGKGYASQILQRIFDHIDKAGASLLLVSGDRSLYTRVNCLPFGVIRRYTVDAAAAQELQSRHASEGVRVRDLEATDWLYLRELAGARLTRFEQSVTDLANLVHSEAFVSCIKMKHRVLVAERDGKPVAFLVAAVPNPPLDPKRVPFLIEAAGDGPAVALLAAYALKRMELEQIELPVSVHESDWQEALAPTQYQEEPNHGTIYVVRPERLIEQLRPYWEETAPGRHEALRVQSAGDGRVKLEYDGLSAELAPQAFISLVFGGNEGMAEHSTLRSSLKELFPVPFPFTAGLNFV